MRSRPANPPAQGAFAVLIAMILAGCDAGGGGFGTPGADMAEYRPQDAGTVDHALCLLGFAHVPVRNVRPGHQLVEATINGVTGDFVLDTGANVTVVDAAQAGRFDLSAEAGGAFGSPPVLFAGSPGSARQVPVDSFAIGAVAIRQRRILVADLGQLLAMLGEVSGREVSGVIGQDALEEHRAVIDVSRPMLYLMEADRDPAPVATTACAAATPDAAGVSPNPE